MAPARRRTCSASGGVQLGSRAWFETSRLVGTSSRPSGDRPVLSRRLSKNRGTAPASYESRALDHRDGGRTLRSDDCGGGRRVILRIDPKSAALVGEPPNAGEARHEENTRGGNCD